MNQYKAKRTIKIFSSMLVLLFVCLGSNAVADEFNYEKWQLARIFTPDEKVLHTENKQQVFIFDGLKDKDVDRAMEKEFERIENFMFIKTIVTDENGEAEVDPLGRLVLESDDCGDF